MSRKHDRRGAAPRVVGLVVAGGRSVRMGRDKAMLAYQGHPQLVRVAGLLESLGLPVVISIRRGQKLPELARGSPTVVDAVGVEGPAAGLLAAWARDESAALLALAVDMPLVDRGVAETLIRSRNPTVIATAFRHPDQTLEPLCTIWEPSARSQIAARAAAGAYSLRELLESAEVCALEPPAPGRLQNVNTPADYEAVSALLSSRHQAV